VFDEQSDEYKESVLPSAVTKRLSVEAGISMGWSKYVGAGGASVSIETFGASAPGDKLMQEFGFTVENVVAKAKEVLG
jgi:transketolase